LSPPARRLATGPRIGYDSCTNPQRTQKRPRLDRGAEGATSPETLRQKDCDR